MMYLKKSIILLSCTLILSACGSSNNAENANTLLELSEKQFVHELFLNEYLWYEDVASNVDYESFSTRDEMINRYKVTPPDRWSFSLSQKEYEDFANQKTQGFGFGFDTNFRLFIVRINAPAYEKLFRGDKLLEINGQPITLENLSQASENINVQTTFTLLRNGVELTQTVTPSEYSFNVSEGKVIAKNGKNIAYLRYDSFTESSVAEFETIFTRFKAANVSELIIDMRYNGGGSVGTASALLDNITNAYPNKRQVYLDWNQNYQGRNETFSFESQDFQDGNELSMKRVFFLVTENSASASELVISALTPYLGRSNVITIGTNTHGKPVGMSGRIYNNNLYFIVNFLVRNNNSISTPFTGIPSTCAATDDIGYRMGDKNEKMLATALYYIDHNRCP